MCGRTVTQLSRMPEMAVEAMRVDVRTWEKASWREVSVIEVVW